MDNNKKDNILIDLLIIMIPLSASAYIAYYLKAQNTIVFIFMFFASLLILPTRYFYDKYKNSKNEVFNWYYPIKDASIILFITFGMFISFYLIYPQYINVFTNVSSNISYPYFVDNSSIGNITGMTYLGNDTIRDYIGTIASSIVALNSIIISITLLIIQYVSDKRGTILMDLFFKDKYFWGYIGITVITVLFAIIGILTFPQNTCVLVFGENLAWNVSNIGLVVLTIGLLLNFSALFVYLKRVSEILSPSKSIWYILDAMTYSEIKNYYRIANGDNTNGIADYAVLFRIYKIIKGLFKNNDLDVAVSCIESLGIYYERLHKKYKNERNARGFFISYSYIIEKLAEVFIDDLKKGYIIKEPYWHRVLESLITSLYKIIETKIRNNKIIDMELETVKRCIINVISIDGENLSSVKITFIDNNIKHLAELFNNEIKKFNMSDNDNIYWNIRWFYKVFKDIAICVISNRRDLISTDNIFLNKILEVIYNPRFIKKVIEKNEKMIFSSIINTLNQVLNEVYKNNLEYHDFTDKIYDIYKIILEDLYNLGRYDIFYNVINNLKQNNKKYLLDAVRKFYIPITTTHTTFETSDIGEKIINILYLAYFDEENLEYELLVYLLKFRNQLDLILITDKLRKYSIEDVEEAMRKLEQNLSKYVKKDEIENVKRNLNNLFEILKNE